MNPTCQFNCDKTATVKFTFWADQSGPKTVVYSCRAHEGCDDWLRIRERFTTSALVRICPTCGGLGRIADQPCSLCATPFHEVLP